MIALGRVTMPPAAMRVATLIAGCIAALVIALLPLELAVLGSVGVIALVLGLVRPAWIAYLLAFAVPFGSLAEMNVGPFSIGAVEALIGVIVVGWFAGTATRGEFRPTITAPLVALFLFIAVLIATSPQAPSLPLALKEVLKWLELAAVLLILSDRHSKVSTSSLMIALFLAATLEALTGWYQFFFRVGPESFLFDRFLRAYGTFGQPNPFAGYLVSVSAVALAALITIWPVRRASGRIKAVTVGAIVMLAISLPAIVMSLSRGAWLGLIAAFLVISLLTYRRTAFALVGAGLLVVLVGLSGGDRLLPPAITQRIDSTMQNFALVNPENIVVTDENWAIVERMANWYAAWDMFEAAPLWGQGAGNFEVVYPKFALEGWNEIVAVHAHNHYLNLLAESGITGLSGYLIFLTGSAGYVINVIIRTKRNPFDSPDTVLLRAAALGALGTVAGITVHNVFDVLYVHGLTVQLALILGLPVLGERLAGIDISAGSDR